MKDKRIGEILTAIQFEKLDDDMTKNATDSRLSTKSTIPQALEIIDKIIIRLEGCIKDDQLRKHEMEEHKKLIESKMGGKNE